MVRRLLYVTIMTIALMAINGVLCLFLFTIQKFLHTMATFLLENGDGKVLMKFGWQQQ